MMKGILEKIRPYLFLTGVGGLCIFAGLSSYSKSQYKIVKESKLGSLVGEGTVLGNYFTTGEWLSEDALTRIQEICDIPVVSIGTEYDSKYLDVLKIDKANTIGAYGSLAIKKNSNHQNEIYYDKEKDDINWELLAEHIYNESTNYEGKEICTYNYTPSFLLSEIETFSKEEINEKVDNIKEITQRLREDFPDFDIQELACTLGRYKIVKNFDLFNFSTKAYTTEDIIVYNTVLVDPTLTNDFIKQIDLHEDFHAVVWGCQDKSDNLFFSKHGISIMSKEEEPDNYRYIYAFLEEIYAELYSSSILNTEQQTYLSFDEILTAIQISLGLKSNYQIDDILEDLVYHDPITFIKHFPVYGKDKEQYFVDNCKMLRAYDILLRDDILYSELLEKEDLAYSYQYNGVDSLYLFASSQLTKTFFNNLIVMNEMHPRDMNLEDNYYMINLFDNTLKNTFQAIKDNTQNLTVGINNSSFYQVRSAFLGYLSDKYQIFKEDIEYEYYRKYSNITPTDYQFPSFLGENKQLYYNTLLKEGENHDVNAPYALPIRGKTYKKD